MRLSKKQALFTVSTAHLVLYAESLGYELTDGDAYATDGHMKNSNHYKRLARDFNLFINGVLIESSEHEAWEQLHDYFSEKFPLAAPMIKNDAGHFSFEHNGVR